MKNFPITIGFDDSKFQLKANVKKTQLIGVVCQGTRLVNVIIDEISIDGDDATDILIGLANHYIKEIQYILTDTITFGGFNIIDIERIYALTDKPIIAITDSQVDLNSVEAALKKNFPNNYNTKMQKIIMAGDLFETEILTAGGPSKVYYHVKGVPPKEVNELLEKVCIDSKLPEPIRIAHLIGKAL
jgi:endonuclease V-like protein UPF0215 family